MYSFPIPPAHMTGPASFSRRVKRHVLIVCGAGAAICLLCWLVRNGLDLNISHCSLRNCSIIRSSTEWARRCSVAYRNLAPRAKGKRACDGCVLEVWAVPLRGNKHLALIAHAVPTPELDGRSSTILKLLVAFFHIVCCRAWSYVVISFLNMRWCIECGCKLARLLLSNWPDVVCVCRRRGLCVLRYFGSEFERKRDTVAALYARRIVSWPGGRVFRTVFRAIILCGFVHLKEWGQNYFAGHVLRCVALTTAISIVL